MKRREAIQQLSWGLSGGLLLPSLLASCSKKDPGPEIVYSGTVGVIGAGVSGLYVADILRTKGINVMVFEANDQLGGRIRSLRNQSVTQYPAIPSLSSDFPLELGAQTVVGSDSIMGRIYQDYNLLSVEFPVESQNFVLDNTPKSAADWGGDIDFNAAQTFVSNISKKAGNSKTVQGAIQDDGINPRAFGMLNGQIGNARGGENAVVGMGELGEEAKLTPTDAKIIALRSNPLQDAVISRFSSTQSLVQLNTAITSVNYSGDRIILTAKDGSTFEVDKVIVTVPVSILKNNGISFNPGLPSSFASSLAKIGMGPSLRVIIEFKKNFWGDSVGFIYGSSNVPEYVSVGLGRSQFNATLSITVHGSKAAQYSAMGDSVINTILADIDLLYAGQGTQFVRKDVDTGKIIYVLHDWAKTNNILGGYSYPLAGATMNDRKAIGQPVSGKVFFAGEATDITGQAGMVNGAMASAERVAQDVVNSIMNPS